MGPERFFQILPMNLSELDLNSLRYAQESRSYLILIVHKFLKKADLVFFMQNFVPQINALNQLRIKCSN